MSIKSASDALQISSNDPQLTELGRKPPLPEYISRIWFLRRFIVTQSRYQSFSSGEGTNLGRSWVILDPFVRILFYYIVFGLILDTSRGVGNFLAFLAVGIIFFRPLQQSLGRGPTLLRRNASFVKSFNAPRATLFIANGARSSFEAIPDLVALLIFIVLIPPHVVPKAIWPLIVAIIVLRQFLLVGMTFISALLTHVLPDLAHVWQLVSRFWFYTSGVIFSIDAYLDPGWMKSILELNPAAIMLDMARGILIEGKVPALSEWVQFAGWSIFIFLVGFVLFWRSEMSLSRERLV